jgi:hypothetical protein
VNTDNGNFPGTPSVLSVNMNRDLPNEGRHTSYLCSTGGIP